VWVTACRSAAALDRRSHGARGRRRPSAARRGGECL